MKPEQRQCPLCRTEIRNRGIHIENGEIYYRCESCDLIFQDYRQLPAPLAEENRYREHNNDPDDPRYCSYLEAFARQGLYRYLDPPARIIDYGSGPRPVLAGLLRKRGYLCDIFDPFFAPNTEPRSGEYQGICCLEVAEHFHHPEDSFERMISLLSPGGYLFLRTHLSPEDPTSFASWWYKRDLSHVSFYSEKSFDYVAGRWGLKLEEIIDRKTVIFRR